MNRYRWNQSGNAAAYDTSAEHIHPHYLEMQSVLLGLLVPPDADFWLVDLGGGSGRLAERFLEQFPQGQALIIDQSEPFLQIAAARLERFDGRGHCLQARLQDDWSARLPASPAAVVSMSAIHHLDNREKQTLYGRCYEVLAPGGVLLNGDEIRPADEGAYLDALRGWAAHMQRELAAGRIHPEFATALAKWQHRNIDRFGAPRSSGDDCHETTVSQLDYLRNAGFKEVDIPWQQQMWAVLRARK